MQSIRKSVLSSKKLFLAVILLVLVPFVLASCENKQQKQMGASNVKVQKLELEQLESKSHYVATMFTRKSTELKPRVNGPIKSIMVEDGAYVTKGTILMTIEGSEQAAAASSAAAKAESSGLDVKQAEATVKASIADVSAAESALELAKIELDRYQKLYEKDSATKSDLDSYTNGYNQALASLASAEENLKAQQKMLEAKKADYKESKESARQDKIVSDYYAIKAPFNGYIGTISMKIGDYVTSSTVLTTITENNNLDVKFSVDLDHRSKLKKDLTVRINDNTGKEPVETKIWFIAPKVDPDTQTVMIKSFYSNADRRFEADQVVEVDVIWSKYQGIAIPTDSVARLAGQNYVFVLAKNDKGQQIASQLPVELGDIQNNKYVVSEGLKAGDTLITSGIQKLRNNVPVTIEK